MQSVAIVNWQSGQGNTLIGAQSIAYAGDEKADYPFSGQSMPFR